MAVLDQRAHEAEEECQQQGADMAAVHIGIGHQDNFAVTQLCEVKIITEARAERGNHRSQLVVAVNTVETRFFDVQHLAPQRQDRLMTAVTAFLGGAACGITLDDVDFGVGRVLFNAVRQLARQGSRIQCRLAAGHLARLLCSLAGTRGGLRLFNNGAGHLRVLFEEGHQLLGNHRVHQRTHFAVAQLGLGLALELRFLQLDRDNRGQTLARVLALEGLIVLEQLVFLAVIVEYTGQSSLKAGLVRTALGGVDVVCKGQHQLAVAVGILHGNLGHRGIAAALHVDHLIVQRRLRAVEVLHELTDTALVVHDLLDRLIVALVAQRDLESGVQERLLAQTLFEYIVFVDRGFEDLRVRVEADGRAGFALTRRIAHLDGRYTALKAHVVLGMAIAYLGLQPVGQRVYDR